jgi:hypothetical protein
VVWCGSIRFGVVYVQQSLSSLPPTPSPPCLTEDEVGDEDGEKSIYICISISIASTLTADSAELILTSVSSLN